MTQRRFSFEKVIGEPAPTSVRLNPEWGSQFSHANGVQFRLAPGTDAYLFLHEILHSKDPKQVADFLRKDGILAHVLNCEGQEWVVKTEPTSDGKFGIIIYTATGKPYISGEGQFDSSGLWSATFATLYPGIRNKKACTVQGGVRGGTGQKTEAEVGGTCTVNF